MNQQPFWDIGAMDLFAVSSYILGLTKLQTPEAEVAADIDFNCTLSTFDVIVLRKMILQNPVRDMDRIVSWLFFSKKEWAKRRDYEFGCGLEHLDLFDSAIIPADFIAIKVGDVNNSALVCDNMANREPAKQYTLAMELGAVERDEVFVVPVKAASAEAIAAWQIGLHFDPDLLEFIGTAQGDLPELDPGSFGLSAVNEGYIRALWFAPPDQIEGQAMQDGQTLFYLSFRARRSVQHPESALSLDNAVLTNRAWTVSGEALGLALQSRTVVQERESASATVVCKPNPGSDFIDFDVKLDSEARVRLSVFDGFGKRLYFEEAQSDPGLRTIRVNEAANWPAGIYNWTIRIDQELIRGQWVKQ